MPAEATVHELINKVQSDPQLRTDAARGVIRGPQLALVELQLHKLALSVGKATEHEQDTEGQQTAGQGKEEQDSARQPLGGEGSNREHEDVTRGLAEAVLSYYKQLGHMLSCAVDLRYPALGL